MEAGREVDYDTLERESGVRRMRADIDNKLASNVYRQGLLKYEPWQVIGTAVAVAAVVFGVIGGFIGYMLAGLH